MLYISGSFAAFSSTVPVRMDWSTRRVVDFIETIRISAGTLSPTGKVINAYIYHNEEELLFKSQNCQSYLMVHRKIIVSIKNG